jgi:hypothetical protein
VIYILLCSSYGKLNQYRDISAWLVSMLDTFHIEHVHRGYNGVANELAQQASGYEVKRGYFSIRGRPASHGLQEVFANDSELAEGSSDYTDWRVVLRECIIGAGITMERKT